MEVLIETQFLPPIISYVHFIKCAKVKIEAYENYQKRSYRNRCHILDSQGESHFSIPLKKGKNQKQSIREVIISYEQDWVRVFINKIKSAYGKSAFFEFYFEYIQDLMLKRPKYLFDLNMELLILIDQILMLEITYKESEDFIPKSDPDTCDLRNKISPLIDKHIELSADFSYPQVFEDKFGFISNLSILDLMFNMGPETGLIIKNSTAHLNDLCISKE